MARKGENIYRRKDGRWEGRFIKEYGLDGRARYGYVYGHSYTEVKVKKLREQQLPKKEKFSPRQAEDFGGVLDLWLLSVQINVKASTFALYSQLVRRHIKPELGPIPLAEMTVNLAERYAVNLLQRGRLDGQGGLSPKTVADIMTIVKRAVAYAKKLGMEPVCDLGGITVKKTMHEMRVLSVEEQEILKTYLLTDMDLTKFGVYLSLFTGLRIGEVCALKWENISLKRGSLEVRHTLQRISSGKCDRRTEITISEPKSQCSIRDIPLPATLVELAGKYQAAPGAYVLTGSAERPLEPRTLQNRFKRYILACGLAPANYHALRHTFATRCVELGFEIKTLSEILGHANVNITLNRYVHSSFNLKRDNMRKLEASMK